MRNATIVRNLSQSGDQGTPGVLTLDNAKSWLTLELPWRNDLAYKSCVPTSLYMAKNLWSEKHQANLYHLVNAVSRVHDDGTMDLAPLEDGRTQIEIHSANLAGNGDAGYFSQLLGCIALGQGRATFTAGTIHGQLKDQSGITASKDALAEFMADLNGEELFLKIVYG